MRAVINIRIEVDDPTGEIFAAFWAWANGWHGLKNYLLGFDWDEDDESE